jgi:hypothetical protein
MPMVFGPHWVDDDFDRQMRRDGYVPKIEAAQAFGRSESWISFRAQDGKLKMVTTRQRAYVSVDSLNALLRAEGPGTADHRIESLIQSGRNVEAQDLHRAIYPENHIGEGMVEMPAIVTRDLPDPVDRFIARNRGGK